MIFDNLKKLINNVPFIKKLILKFILEFKKGKIRQLIHYIFKGHLISNFKISNYSKNNNVKKLQIGGGKHIKKGWLNGDILFGDIYLNATNRFPIKSNSFDYIFAEQFLEHLNFNSGKNCLEEAYRVLKPGGLLRITTPDLKGLFSVYENNNIIVRSQDVLERHRKNHNKDCFNLCHFLNDNFRMWGHSFIYDIETLEKLFLSIGFQNIKHVKFGTSEYSELNGLEVHADTQWMKSAYQIIVEVKKSN